MFKKSLIVLALAPFFVQAASIDDNNDLDVPVSMPNVSTSLVEQSGGVKVGSGFIDPIDNNSIIIGNTADDKDIPAENPNKLLPKDKPRPPVAKSDSDIAIGNSAYADSQLSGAPALAFGNAAVSKGEGSVAIGSKAVSNGLGGIAIGDASKQNNGGISIGSNSNAGVGSKLTAPDGSEFESNQSVAIGTDAKVVNNARESIALGANSVAGKMSTEKALFLDENNRAGQNVGELSVGQSAENSQWGEKDTYRRITNVAGGAEDTDVANIAQLKAVNETATEAKTTADGAKIAADNAQTTATEAKTAAGTALTTANDAKTTADTALTTATEAKTTAGTALTTANEAKTAADNAQNTANTALTTATDAKATAGTALTTANEAKATAATALTTATGAKTAADNAQKTADGAQTTANTALNSVNEVKTTVNEVKTTANTALTTANEAKTTANTALTSVNEVKVTANTALTTATDAKTTANQAQTSADKAQTSADNAQNTAVDAKNIANTANTTANNANYTSNIANNTANTANNTANIANKTANNAWNLATHNSARIDKLENRMNDFDDKMKRGFAMSAATANLFQPYSVGKFNVSAAIGGYNSENAIAVGSGYRFNENIAAKASVSTSTSNSGDLMYGAGVNFEW
ncbi:YadA-like family protein [Proteus hauseri]|uniref:YadA-like family protein n=1 Tax=Proteus hauseri TaxID=183417 RepID=UPI0032DB4031